MEEVYTIVNRVPQEMSIQGILKMVEGKDRSVLELQESCISEVDMR